MVLLYSDLSREACWDEDSMHWRESNLTLILTFKYLLKLCFPCVMFILECSKKLQNLNQLLIKYFDPYLQKYRRKFDWCLILVYGFRAIEDCKI